MAIVRRPGQIVEYVLPGDENLPEEEQTRVKIKVPTEEVRKVLLSVPKQGTPELADWFWRAFSLAIVDVVNLKVEGVDGRPPEPFVLEKDKEGRLTRASWEVLSNFTGELSELIGKVARLEDAERKNF